MGSSLSDLEFYIGAIYFLTTAGVGVIGWGQGFFQLDATNPQCLVFRKSNMVRLSLGMTSLMLLVGIGTFASGMFRPGDREMFWWLVAPIFVSVSYFLTYLAGPQDVCIDLTTRTCYETKGWFFRPRQQTYPLTEASYLCALCIGNYCFTMLRIGDAADHRIMLAMRNNRNEAMSIAQNLAEKMHLPVKEPKGPKS